MLLSSKAYAASSIDFDGSSHYLDMDNVLNFEKNVPKSVTLWVRADSAQDAELVSKKDASSNNGWGMGLTTANSPMSVYHHLRGSPPRDFFVYSFDTIQATTWYFIGWTFGGDYTDENDVAIYINGTLATNILDENALLSGDTTVNTHELFLGVRTDGVGPLDGQMFNVKIYNRVLSQAEIQTAMHCMNQPTEGVVAHWPLWSDPDVNVEDLSENSYDGSNVGTTESSLGPPTSWC